MGKETKKTTMTLRPKGGNYRGALDTGTAAAAALTTQGVRGTNPRETGYITQDANDGLSAEHDSSSTNTTTISKIRAPQITKNSNIFA